MICQNLGQLAFVAYGESRQFVGGGVFTKKLYHFLLGEEGGFAIKSCIFKHGAEDVLDFICDRGVASSLGWIHLVKWLMLVYVGIHEMFILYICAMLCALVIRLVDHESVLIVCKIRIEVLARY